jgi:hypothetical protein
MAETDFGGQGQARCALHPEEWASGTCERCGNFMCGLCSDSGAQPWCPTCRERAGSSTFPLRRDTWTFGALWEYAWAAFKTDWLNLSLAALIVLACTFGVQFVGRIFTGGASAMGNIPLVVFFSLVFMVAQYFVQGIVTMGLVRLCFDVLNGREVELEHVFSQVHKAGRYLGATLFIWLVFALPILFILFGALVVGAIVGGVSAGELSEGESVFREAGEPMVVALVCAGLLIFFPAMYFGLPLMLLPAEFVFNEDSTALGALRNCYVLARGQRLGLLLLSLVSILLAFVGLILCCIAFIPAWALIHMLVAGLYLALRRGSELEREPR